MSERQIVSAHHYDIASALAWESATEKSPLIDVVSRYMLRLLNEYPDDYPFLGIEHLRDKFGSTMINLVQMLWDNGWATETPEYIVMQDFDKSNNLQIDIFCVNGCSNCRRFTSSEPVCTIDTHSNSDTRKW